MANARLQDQTDLPALQAAYRKALVTILGHAGFFVVCCAIAIVARRLFKMPPALLTVAFFIALFFFGGDLLRFLSCRRELRRWHERFD